MGEFFSALAIAVISALAYIAYTHPREFRVLAIILIFVIALISVVVGAWNMAVLNSSSAFYSVMPEAGTDKQFASYQDKEDFFHKADAKIRAEQIWPSAIDGVCISAMAYLWLLQCLPLLGIVEKEKVEAPKGPEQKKAEEAPPK